MSQYLQLILQKGVSMIIHSEGWMMMGDDGGWSTNHDTERLTRKSKNDINFVLGHNLRIQGLIWIQSTNRGIPRKTHVSISPVYLIERCVYDYPQWRMDGEGGYVIKFLLGPNLRIQCLIWIQSTIRGNPHQTNLTISPVHLIERCVYDYPQ